MAFANTLSVFRPIGGREREKKEKVREEESRAAASTLSLDLYALKF